MNKNDTPLKHPDRIFVGGSWIEPSTDAKLPVIMPSTEQLFLEVAEAQPADVDRAVEAARTAFDTGPWPRMSHAERAVYLDAIADEILRRKPELIDMWVSEVGTTISIVPSMVDVAAYRFRYYAELSKSFPFRERHAGGSGAFDAYLVREPVGVVAAILPWNGPIVMGAGKAAAALIAGCSVVMKASPEAPGGVYMLSEIIESVGLPAGVFNMIAADRAASEHLVRHTGVDKVTFTGSSAAGKRVGSICGERLARVTLELGGKSPGIVLDDYDLEKVAKSIAVSAPMNTGQACNSLTRIIVSQPRHDALVEAMAAEFAKIRVGDPFAPASRMGPLTMARQRDRVESYVAKGVAEGAVLATGGRRPAHLNRGYYIEPTLFANVDNNMTIAREEIFGPVVSVIPARDEAHAIVLANDTEFGLNASIFTDDMDRFWKVAAQVRSGTVGHNGYRASGSIALGGYKQSGVGREGGAEGLHSFLETKVVMLDADIPAEVLSA